MSLSLSRVLATLGPDSGPPSLPQVALPTPWGSHPPLRGPFQVLWWCQWFLAPCLQPTLSSTTKMLQFFCPHRLSSCRSPAGHKGLCSPPGVCLLSTDSRLPRGNGASWGWWEWVGRHSGLCTYPFHWILRKLGLREERRFAQADTGYVAEVRREPRSSPMVSSLSTPWASKRQLRRGLLDLDFTLYAAKTKLSLLVLLLLLVLLHLCLPLSFLSHFLALVLLALSTHLHPSSCFPHLSFSSHPSCPFSSLLFSSPYPFPSSVPPPPLPLIKTKEELLSHPSLVSSTGWGGDSKQDQRRRSDVSTPLG